MKKLLICCLAILLAGVPVSTVSAAAPSTLTVITDENFALSIEMSNDLSEKFIKTEESFILSPDSTSMETTITLQYQGEVVPARSVPATKTIGTKVYKGTVYLDSYWYLNGVTTAVYEGTLYLVSGTSTS